MEIYFKRSSSFVKIPIKAYDHAACWDLYAYTISVVDSDKYGYIEYNTGISVEIPNGYVGLLFPRSSISNTGLILANSVGVIDPDYRGDLIFRFKYVKDTNKYEVGDKIGQIMIIKNVEVKWTEHTILSSTSRSTGSFGSSGN